MSTNWLTNLASMSCFSNASRVYTSAARRLICLPTCAAGTRNLPTWHVGYGVRYAENGNARHGPCPSLRRGDIKATDDLPISARRLCGECQAAISIQSVPIGIHDARRLPNLAGDQRQLVIRKPTHVDLDVKQIVRREVGGHSPGNDIQVLETFNDPSNRAGISICDNLKASPRIGLWRIHGTNASYRYVEEQAHG
jgi:hypothetical protein